jgi:hypothetical protein
MKITQISVFLENKMGRLADVCTLLSAAQINIRALTIAESPEFGILRMVVDQPNEAVALLKKNSFVANITDIVAVEVADQPGGLARIARILSEHTVNVEYVYGFVEKNTDRALMVFRFDDTDRALQVLKENQVTIVGSSELNAW